jgi:hypothetical protein
MDEVTFCGEFRSNHRKIINIKQSQEQYTYYAFYQGIELPTGLVRYRGNWVDVNEKSGQFELVMPELLS